MPVEALKKITGAPVGPQQKVAANLLVRFEMQGHTIVIRGADNKDVVYTLSPTFVMPDDVKVGRRVTAYTEPGTDGGTQLVTRVTTTTVTPEGNIKKTTEDTRTLPSGVVTKTTTTEISGTVQAWRLRVMLPSLRGRP